MDWPDMGIEFAHPNQGDLEQRVKALEDEVAGLKEALSSTNLRLRALMNKMGQN
jgi:uncharacterized protein YceH (UPF0502 family)